MEILPTDRDYPLPECLERVDGAVRVRGHRVSLFSVLDAWLSGEPIGRVRERFPTIEPGTIRDVIEFCDHNAAVMRRLHATTREAMDAERVARGKTTPTLEDLRRRFRETDGKGVSGIAHELASDPR